MADEKIIAQPKWVEHHLWYLVIGIVILASSIFLCLLIYNIHFLNCYEELIPNETAKRVVEYFLLGMLGSASFSAYFFAKDCNRYFRENKGAPNYLDALGYVIHIFGGGITGLILILLVKAGFIAVSETSGSIFKESFAMIIALLGGIQSVQVKNTLFRLGKNIMKNKE